MCILPGVLIFDLILMFVWNYVGVGAEKGAGRVVAEGGAAAKC